MLLRVSPTKEDMPEKITGRRRDNRRAVANVVTTPEDPRDVAIKSAEIVRAEVSTMLEFFRDEFRVEDQESLDLAGAQVVELRKKAKELDRRIRTFTDPLKKAIKETRAAIDQAKSWAAPAEKLLTECEQILKLKMSVYVNELAEKNREAIKLAAEASAEDDHEAVTDALSTITTANKVDGVSFGEIWDFKLTNAHMVPKEYLLLNSPAVREMMRRMVAAGDEPVIPGILFFKRPVTTVRA